LCWFPMAEKITQDNTQVFLLTNLEHKCIHT
jgi:hypothetical protein